MNPHVRRFFLIFFVIGVLVCAGLAVANAAAQPADAKGAIVFAVIAVVLLGGALAVRSRREA